MFLTKMRLAAAGLVAAAALGGTSLTGVAAA
jgi:hypothetical protein